MNAAGKHRVVHVLWSPEFGGIERLALDLARDQANDEQFAVSILFGQSKGAFRTAFEESGIQVDFLDFSSGYDLAPWKIVRAREILNQNHIIHLHGFVLPLSLAAAACSAPIVYTEHGNFALGRRRTFGDRLRQKLLPRFWTRHVSAITFNSHFTHRLWQEIYAIEHPQQHVIPNGISFSESPSVVSKALDLQKLLQGTFVVGTTSRFVAFKRIDRLIRAFAKFQSQRNTTLLLVGDGLLRPELEKLIQELKIRSKTVLAGFRSDVRACQSLMDVCVFPSQQEPFGLVAVETLSVGKPTIVFKDGGGIVDIVEPLCRSEVVRDENELCHRLEHYYSSGDSPGDAERRMIYARQFDIHETSSRFKEIYLGLN